MKKTLFSLMLFSSLLTLTGCFKGCSKDKDKTEQSLDKKEENKGAEENKGEKNKAEMDSMEKAEMDSMEKNNTEMKGMEKTNTMDEQTSNMSNSMQSTAMMDQTMGPDDFSFQEEEKSERDFGYGEPRSRFI